MEWRIFYAGVQVTTLYSSSEVSRFQSEWDKTLDEGAPWFYFDVYPGKEFDGHSIIITLRAFRDAPIAVMPYKRS